MRLGGDGVKRQELGAAKGLWIGRERIPDGYAALIENGRILGDYAIRSRRGAATHADVVGKNLRHARPFRISSGRAATIAIADDGSVHDVETTTPVAVGTVDAAAEYSSAQGLDRFYVATGADPSVIAEDGAALVIGDVALPQPPAPTLISIGAAGVPDPADPDLQLQFAAVAPGVGTAGALYGATTGGTEFRKYDIAANTWSTPAARPIAMTDHVILERSASEQLVYAPECGISGPIGAGTRTHYFNPATNVWGANKPLIDPTATRNVYWSAASSMCTSKGLWGSADYAVLYFHRDTGFGTRERGYALFQLTEGPTETNVVHVVNIETTTVADGGGAALGGWGFIDASQMRVVTSAGLIFIQYDNALGRANTTNGTFTAMAGPGFTLTRFDEMVFAGGTSDYIYVYRETTQNVRRYTISTNGWTNLGNDGATKLRGIVGGQPANQNIYYFASLFDFRSIAIPDAAALPSGDYDYVITWTNSFQQSLPSAVLAVPDVPDGSTITIGLPAAPAGVTGVNIFRTLKDGETFGLRAAVAAAATQYADTASDAGFLDFGTSPPGSIGTGAGGVVPAGAKYVIFDDEQTVWANLTGGSSDFMWSRKKSPEIFSSLWRLSLDANDGDEIVGLVGLPAGRLFFKRRSLHLIAGDLGEPPDAPGAFLRRAVSRSIGCRAPRSIARLGRDAYFVGGDKAQRGVYVTDGVNRPVRISSPVLDEVIPSDVAAAVGFVADDRYYVTFDGVAFYVFDPQWGRWETRLTLEAHRTLPGGPFGSRIPIAPIVDACYVDDVDRRLAVFGYRVARFGEDDATGVSTLDPLRVRFGPLPYFAFEQDFFVQNIIVRYKGDLTLYYVTDYFGAFYQSPPGGPPAPSYIALGAAGATVSRDRTMPTKCYGRRVFLELVSIANAATPATFEGLEVDARPLEREESAA